MVILTCAILLTGCGGIKRYHNNMKALDSAVKNILPNHKIEYNKSSNSLQKKNGQPFSPAYYSIVTPQGNKIDVGNTWKGKVKNKEIYQENYYLNLFLEQQNIQIQSRFHAMELTKMIIGICQGPSTFDPQWVWSSIRVRDGYEIRTKFTGNIDDLPKESIYRAGFDTIFKIEITNNNDFKKFSYSITRRKTDLSFMQTTKPKVVDPLNEN